MVSEKHSGFLINAENASCADVRELIRQVQEAVGWAAPAASIAA